MSPPVTLPTPEVIRVHDARGSRIEPPCEDGWDQATKLAWHAAVVALDTGLPITVTTGGLRRKNARRWWRPRPRWHDVPDMYGVRIGTASISPVTFAGAWDLLNGICLGVRAVQR